jgi:parvulin-like peptidyl-prolyl isomerase
VRRATGIGHVLVAGLLVACGNADPARREAADPDALAVYDGGEVTRQDLDEAVRSGELGPDLMTAPKTADWYDGVICQLAAQELMLAEAELVGVADNPEFRELRGETLRQLVLQLFLDRNPPTPAPVTPDDARRFYAEHMSEFEQPERREVSHIFLRRRPGSPPGELRTAAEALRARAAAGESFAALAEAHSESESRHRGGSLGWIERGQYPAGLEDVVFGLPAGEPSAPVLTTDGAHVFLVERIIGGRTYEFAEVENLIRGRLAEARRDAAIEALITALPLPADSFVPERQELAVLLRGDDRRALVLRIGDYQLHVDRFRQLALARRANLGDRATPDLEFELLRSLDWRERVFQGSGLADDAVVRQRFEALRDRDLLSLYRSRGVRARLDRDPERLARFYDSNKMRFARPARLELRRLAVPLDATTASVTMDRLEAAHRGLSDGTLTMDALAAEMGVAIEDLGWVSLPAFWHERLHAARMVIDLKRGEFSAPYRTESTLEVLEVLDRREPEARPYGEVTGEVLESYLESHQQELFRQWEQELLDEAGLLVFRDRVAELAGPPGPPS